MLKVDLFDYQGKKKPAVALPKKYDAKVNSKLLSQAVHVYEDRTHLGLSKVKTRSEVVASTKKVYRQKGTGGARHGAKSAPIYVGGGVAHGPKGIKTTLKLSKLIKVKALIQAVNAKADDSLVLVDGIGKSTKTKDAAKLVKEIIKEKGWANGSILVALSQKNQQSSQAFRNIEGVTVDSFRNLNAYKVYIASGTIIDKDALEETNEVKKVEVENEKVSTKAQVSASKKEVKVKSTSRRARKPAKSTAKTVSKKK